MVEPCSDEGLLDDLSAPAPEVATRLLGATFAHHSSEGAVVVRVTEVEAYGADDPASHAFRGVTARNRVMFGPAGRLYSYLSHGIHWCHNVVTGPEGEASAVLLRAGEVVEGLELARERRGERVPDHRLARGPGCLGQALGLRGAHDGERLDGAVRLVLGNGVPAAQVRSGPRVGVRLAHERPWRYWVADDPTVSAYRRHPRAGSA